MTAMVLRDESPIRHISEDKRRRRCQDRWLCLGVICLAIGVGVCASGLVLGACLLFGLADGNGGLSRLDTGLFVTAFPLLILAAHGLDRASAKPSSLKQK